MKLPRCHTLGAAIHGNYIKTRAAGGGISLEIAAFLINGSNKMAD